MLPYGTKCTVHVNLHRQKRGLPHFAVTVKGKVVAYAREVEVLDARPRVACSTFARMERDRKGGRIVRKVYAKVEGVLARVSGGAAGRAIHINPHRCREFTVGKGGPVWTGSERVRFVGGVLVEVVL